MTKVSGGRYGAAKAETEAAAESQMRLRWRLRPRVAEGDEHRVGFGIGTGSCEIWFRASRKIEKQGMDLIDLRQILEGVIFGLDPFGGLGGCYGLRNSLRGQIGPQI